MELLIETFQVSEEDRRFPFGLLFCCSSPQKVILSAYIVPSTHTSWGLWFCIALKKFQAFFAKLFPVFTQKEQEKKMIVVRGSFTSSQKDFIDQKILFIVN